MSEANYLTGKPTQPRWGYSRSTLRSQGSREARQPWAMFRKRFAVNAERIALDQAHEASALAHFDSAILLSTRRHDLGFQHFGK